MAIDVTTIYGVDFSGAALAGRNIWIAETSVTQNGRLKLVSLNSLENLCGSAERDPALTALVQMITASKKSLWGIDFPFGLPIEIMNPGDEWPQQLQHVLDWKDQAHALGLWCIDRAKRVGDKMHIRRVTDTETKTPFDCYHYRIIYQTFHGMRDVLAPLTKSRGTAILPFQYPKLAKADRVVVEACPGSTLKRMNLPHNNYKQPTGGPLTRVRRVTRRKIVAGIEPLIEMDLSHVRVMMRNPGGDALDAVIAAVGTAWAWGNADHDGISKHPRYRLEGRLYC